MRILKQNGLKNNHTKDDIRSCLGLLNWDTTDENIRNDDDMAVVFDIRELTYDRLYCFYHIS